MQTQNTQPAPTLKKGDKVNFVVVTTRSSGSVRFSAKEGVLLKLGGTYSQVQSKGKIYIVDNGDMRPQAAPIVLTEADKQALAPISVASV